MSIDTIPQLYIGDHLLKPDLFVYDFKMTEILFIS